MRTKALNTQVLLEMLSYVSFGICILYLLCTGSYLTYVTPRLQPYLWFTAGVMLIWAGIEISQLFRPQYRQRGLHCLVLLIPVMFFLLPHSALSTADISTSASGGAITYPSSNNTVAANADDTEKSTASTTALPDEIQTSMQQDVGRLLTGINPEQKSINIGTDDFCAWVDELYMNTALYEGYTVTLSGYVYKNSQYLSDTEFAAARLAMTCCTADLMPYGLVCTYEQASTLEADTWVTVVGILHNGEKDGQDEPQVAVTQITPTDEIPGYVYP